MSGQESSFHPESDRLLLDVMLGKLAVYLRLCGYDAAYAGDRGVEADDRILDIVTEENRTLLTRDVSLAGQAESSILLTKRNIEDQLAELREAGVELAVAETPTRCGRCNGSLLAVDATEETPEYAPDPDDTDCWRCRECGQLFWKGSHWKRMKETLN
ncbi:Mut7-C RNAse domain-containing protein [Natronomonas sp. CBA1123]|uniref:Mut7-C RNAse domain-containing protein n=1 Tax=Natronomonas sp. CBA1123 TaxID=2668070 RepID=UPI00351BA6D2